MEKTNIPEILKACRKGVNMTQAQFAKTIGIKRSAYAYYESGRTRPKIETLRTIAKVYGLDVNTLISNEDSNSLITRGLAELSRLGNAMGCSPDTFSGLTGMGDLIVTCTSLHSRNNNAGFLIGQGLSPDEAVKKVGMVVEGIYALPAAIKLGKKYNIDLPIINAVNNVVNGIVSPRVAVNSLLNREKRTKIINEIFE